MMKQDQMRIKSYFAKSVDQAMNEARADLGAEAMLLNTRKASADQPGGGGYEVIFGVPGKTPATASGPAWAPAVAPAINVESRAEDSRAQDVFASELKQLHDQMDEIR